MISEEANEGKAGHFFDAAIEQSPFAFQVYAIDGTTLHVNAAWERLWGATRDDVRGFNVLKDPQVQSMASGQIQRAFEGEVVTLPPFLYEPERVGRKGRPRWVRAHYYPVKDANGELLRVVQMIEDVTDSKNVEEKLRESASYFRTLADAMPNIVYSMDGEGHPQFFNSRWYSYTGLDPREQDADCWREFIHPDDLPELDEKWRESTRKKTVFEHEYRLKRFDHTYRWHLGRSVRLTDASGKITQWIGTATDIEDQKRSQILSARLFDEAQDAVRARNEFLGVASHELKTPITAMLLQLDLQKRRLLKRDSKGHRSEEAQGDGLVPVLDGLQRQLRRLSSLVEDMLDVSRISNGRLELRQGPVDLGDLLDEIAEKFSGELDHQGISLRMEKQEAILGNWDRYRLEQVMTNLLSNAIKYGEGEPIRIRMRRDQSWAVIEVQDQGPGVAPEHRERIFHRFERATSSSGISGLGLGLYISREIIESHGGFIRVEPAAPRGAVFIIELPL